MTEQILHLELSLDSPVSEVWKKWTTADGIKSFFAPGCNISIEPDGAFEIFFFPDNPPGRRGADGQRVMAVEPNSMLSFTWNFPPNLAEIRDQRTIVVLRFKEEGQGCLFSLNQLGWGTSPVWQEGYEYFKHAWGEVVLPRLQQSLEHGPIDWSIMPD